MNELQPATQQIADTVYENEFTTGQTTPTTLEPAINEIILAHLAQAWQDGHDTALINGQSENPYDKDAK